jgi:hypothetical protein
VIFNWRLVLLAAFNSFLVTLFMGSEAANLTLQTIGGFFPHPLGNEHLYKYIPMIYEASDKITVKYHKKGEN